MKKILVLGLSLITSALLTACGGGDDPYVAGSTPTAGAPTTKGTFTAVVAFGDSLSDNGAYAPATSLTGNGQPPYFGGKFTTNGANGTVWVENLATRLGLSGVPVAAETIALHTIFELLKTTGARVHLCRISSAAGVELLRRAKAEGLKVTADVSINSLHLTDVDIGFFDSRARLSPPLRQQRDRDALNAALADGTIDALVSDHTPVDEDAKTLPFAEAEPGATGLELLLSLALKWSQDSGVPLQRALATVTSEPARVLGSALGTLQASVGQIVEGGVGDLCIFDPQAAWTVQDDALRSQGKHTPFSGYELPGCVRMTLVGGQVAFDRG